MNTPHTTNEHTPRNPNRAKLRQAPEYRHGLSSPPPGISFDDPFPLFISVCDCNGATATWIHAWPPPQHTDPPPFGTPHSAAASHDWPVPYPASSVPGNFYAWPVPSLGSSVPPRSILDPGQFRRRFPASSISGRPGYCALTEQRGGEAPSSAEHSIGGRGWGQGVSDGQVPRPTRPQGPEGLGRRFLPGLGSGFAIRSCGSWHLYDWSAFCFGIGFVVRPVPRLLLCLCELKRIVFKFQFCVAGLLLIGHVLSEMSSISVPSFVFSLAAQWPWPV
mmetsp:Transcript_23461/g.73515  ORF Transcript_23461/g.73515 Transcript_23461/m.73515 type:complete len:276 (+) Transcript_23461:150-977(+)